MSGNKHRTLIFSFLWLCLIVIVWASFIEPTLFFKTGLTATPELADTSSTSTAVTSNTDSASNQTLFSTQDFSLIAEDIQASDSESLPVLIGFTDTPGDNEIALVKEFGGTITHIYHLVPAIAARVPKENIFNLFTQPSVETVELDHYGLTKKSLDLATTSLTLSSSTPAVILQAPAKTVSIAILDSGVDDSKQPDIKQYYAGGYNFVNNTDSPLDDNGHGTHVTSIVVSLVKYLSSSLYTAPPIKIYGLKVLDDQGAAYFSNIIAALEWSVDHHINITNNSYGTLDNPGRLVKQAFDTANQDGILNIAAAGNSGSCDGTSDTIEYPARFDSVVAVGAVDTNAHRPCFSSTGQEIDLVAPGVSIISAERNGSFTAYTGTSMSAPNVTAVAAILEAGGVEDKNDNGIINDDIKTILHNSAYDLGPSGFDPQYGYGLINLKAALSYIHNLSQISYSR